jgi:two-component system, NtrC family, response regulator AtoC
MVHIGHHPWFRFARGERRTVRGSVLIVDDDCIVRESLRDALAADGLDVRCAESAGGALAALDTCRPDVLLTDVRMPVMDGLELLGVLRERAPEIDVILMTAFDDMATVVTAMRQGATDFLVKPLDVGDLRRALGRVLEDRRARQRARRDSSGEDALVETHELVGHDPWMIEIFKLVGKVAAGTTNVLIRGESGTGKELIARAIHLNSANAAEPFVPVNCTALPSTLLESELFGHVKGSFTGAHADRRGRFAQAGRGTIFLDEIGDTSAEFQSKLLRVLQEREFYPVGADRPIRTEARVVAATHRDLERLVAASQFRADLYYRLMVVEIAIPPLRERVSDIPHLAGHLLERAAGALGRPRPVLDPEALARLEAHDWPGNVRELENCLRRAMVLATGDVIRAEHIPLGREMEGAAGSLPNLDAVEREHISRVFSATGSHKSRTAEILGVSRPRLDRLLRKHGIE